MLVLAAGGATAFPAYGLSSQVWFVLAEDGQRVGEQRLDCSSRTVCQGTLTFVGRVEAPRFVETWRLAADGSVIEYRADGESARGLLISDRFSIAGDPASGAVVTTGHTGSTPHGYYVPAHPSPANIALLTEEAARHGGRIGLLPAGTLRQRPVASLAPGNGPVRHRLVLLLQVGLDLPPGFVWVTDTASPRLVAVIRPGYMTIVAAGHESDLAAMAEAQRTAEVRLLEDVLRETSRPLAGTTVIRNARVFDSERATLIAARDIYIRDGRIVAVEPAGSRTGLAALQIDARGRVVLPGLFDMHVHLQRWDGALHLAAGVTTVRDLGNDDVQLDLLRTELDVDEVAGPRVIPVGFLDGAVDYSAPYGVAVSTLDGALAAIDGYAADGRQQVKTYNNVPVAMLPALAAHAHRRNLRISGHVPPGADPAVLIDAGFDEIHHVDQLLLSTLPAPDGATSHGDRFESIVDRLADVELDGAPVRKVLDLLLRHQTAVDPTVTALGIPAESGGPASVIGESWISRLPVRTQQAFRASGPASNDAAVVERYRQSFAKRVGFVGLLHRAGVSLVVGSDGVPGFGLQRELVSYVQAGIPAAEVLRLATWSAARQAGVLGGRGSIEVGKLADLVLVDGDPTANIEDMTRVSAVFTRGRMYDPAAIRRTLGIEPLAAAQAASPAPR